MRLGALALGVALAAGALILWNHDSANRATASAALQQRATEIPVSTYNHVLMPRLPEATTATVPPPPPARAVSIARGVADANAGDSDDGEGSSSSGGGMSVSDIVKLMSQPPPPDAQMADPTSSQHWPSPLPPPRTPPPPQVAQMALAPPPPRPTAPPDLLRGVPEASDGADFLGQARLANLKSAALRRAPRVEAVAATEAAAAAEAAGRGRGLRRKMGRGKGGGSAGAGAEATSRGEAAAAPSPGRPGGACPAQPPSGKLRVVSDVTKARARGGCWQEGLWGREVPGAKKLTL